MCMLGYGIGRFIRSAPVCIAYPITAIGKPECRDDLDAHGVELYDHDLAIAPHFRRRIGTAQNSAHLLEEGRLFIPSVSVEALVGLGRQDKIDVDIPGRSHMGGLAP